MKRLVLLLVLALFGAVALVGCGSGEETSENGSDEKQEQDGGVDYSQGIQVRGSDTMVNLAQRWAEVFMDENPEASIAVTGGGSGTGISALINGTIDMAIASRAMKDEEIQQASDNGIEAVEYVTGRDGIAVAVNPENPVEELTMADLKAIFTGEVTNWSEFGGNDAEITLYSRESNSGTYAFFREFVLEEEDYASFANLMPSTEAIVEGVNQDVNGIGYIGLAYLENDGIKGVSVAKEEGGEAVEPTVEGVVSGDYPVSRPLFVYTAGEPEGAVKVFVDFIMGDGGQTVVEDIGFVPVQ